MDASVMCNCNGQCGPCSGLMSGLMGALLAAGSQVRVGFSYEFTSNVGAGTLTPSWMQDVIEGGLYNTGEFDFVSISVTSPRYVGLQDGYILINATMAVDKGAPEDFGALAQGVIQENFPDIIINRRDAVQIDWVPQDRTDAEGPTQQSQQQQGKCPVGYYDAGWWSGCKLIQAGTPPPSQCDWDRQSFGDYLTCQLGITTPTAVAMGAALALVGIILIGKATR